MPPVGMITPKRHYFLFGRPLRTAELRADDRAGCERAYAELKARVEGGIERLRREVRANDPYAGLAERTAYEAFYGATAPVE